MTRPSSLALPDSGYQYPESGVGFDTFAVSGPTHRSNMFELDRVWHQQGIDYDTGELRTSRPGGHTQLVVGMGSVSVRIFNADDQLGTVMRLETSGPRMVTGHNWDALAIDQIEAVVDELLVGVGKHFVKVPTVEQVCVRRLDLTRDFLNVRNPAATLAAIAGHHVPHATVSVNYLRQDGALQTLSRGTRDYWLSRGYDKVVEQAGRSCPPVDRSSQLRFELQLRRKGLRRHGLTTTHDLMTADLRGLTRSYFERCNYDVNTASTSASIIFEKMKEDGVTNAEIKNVQAYLFAQQHDCPFVLSKNPFQTVKALVRRYRLSPTSLGTETFERRLDFDTGVEIVE